MILNCLLILATANVQLDIRFHTQIHIWTRLSKAPEYLQ